MKLADYVINYLGDQGIKDVFVVYGAANGDLIDAFTRTNKTRYVAVMHEQGGGFAAEGWAKVTGKPGVAIVTSGPGGQNLLTSMGNCFYDSVPCVFFTGQINSKFLRPSEELRQIGFQETDIVGMATPVTKYAKMITNPKDIRYELEKAFHIAQSGRPGPVLLDIPLDVQKVEIDPDNLIGYDPSLQASYAESTVIDQVDSYLSDLCAAKRPAMMIGAGVRLADAVEDVLELGRLLKMPVFPTWNALDIICSDYEYYGGRIGTYGGAGRNFGIQNSDLLLAIGSRISGRITGGNVPSFAREAKKYVVDIDEPALQKHLQQLPFDECILYDAKKFIQLLIRRIKERGDTFHATWWNDKVRGWKHKYDTVSPHMYNKSDTVHPYAFMRTLSEEMESKDILVADCGGNIVVTNHAFETKTGQRYFTNNGNSPMGFSMAGAMGAAFAADPGVNVVCIIGDGGMNMNIQELQTIKNYGVKVKVIILNNHIYGITKAYQEVNFEGRSEACGPKGYNPPNFLNIAKAYGLKTVAIDSGENWDSIRDQIRTILDTDEAIICDVDCHEYHTYDPKIVGWDTPIEDMYPWLPREEFLSNMYIQPLECSVNRDTTKYF